MATEDKRRQFDEIVDRLITDYPSLARPAGRHIPRSMLIPLLATGAVLWGLLSVSMVAWGWKGVVLTCTVVALTAITLVVDAYRHRR
jgi:hypothetical protein